MDVFETGDRRFILVRGSDVERDGMYLELLDEETQRAVAEVFYSDASDAMTFTAYDEDLPLRAIERLIERGKELLAPTSSLRAGSHRGDGGATIRSKTADRTDQLRRRSVAESAVSRRRIPR